jgi:hypothetical protein
MESQRFYDSKGYPIYKGDLIRSFHFRGANKRIHYLYHVVVEEDEVLYMVPTSHIEPTCVSGGGKCLLKYAGFSPIEIISGHGPGDILIWYDRPKREEPQ